MINTTETTQNNNSNVYDYTDITVIVYESNALTVTMRLYRDYGGYHDMSDGLGILSEIPGISDFNFSGFLSYDFELSLKCSINYQYIDPDDSDAGDYTDMGRAVLEAPTATVQSDYDLDLPLNLIPLSLSKNADNFNGIDTNIVLDEISLESFYQHQFFGYHNGDLIKSYNQFIGIVSLPRFSVAFDKCDYNNCSLSIHSPN